MIRFGKSSEGMLAIKAAFVADNDRIRDDLGRIASVYVQQPRRERCKACDNPLPAEADFSKQGVAYAFCPRCGHMNGLHEDTAEFCRAVYTDDGGQAYGRNYSAEDRAAFEDRVRTIYAPKAEFMAEVLRAQGHDPASLRYADLGAGSGYYVSALRKAGLSQATGYEVGESQVAFANAMVGPEAVRRHALDDIDHLAATVPADVISMIGVLEHLQHPRAILAAICSNPSARYLYISVPLFSACVFLEMAFPDVMPRHLAGGHTHLYCEESLDWTCREFGLERVGEWWFGSDLLDLFRSISVQVARGHSAAMAERWGAVLLPALDDMQLALDKRKLSSEVHMVLRLQR